MVTYIEPTVFSHVSAVWTWVAFREKDVVLSECVASFDPAGHEFALNHFKNTLGMELAKTL